MSEGRLDRTLVVATALLLGLSVLMVYSATGVTAEETVGDATIIIRKHLLHICLGLFALLVAIRVKPESLEKIALPFLGVVIAMLVLVLIPTIGHIAGGARRWLILGPLRAQPGELVKIGAILYFAAYIERYHERMGGFLYGVLIPLGIVGVISGLLLLEPDFGSTVIVLSVVFCQLLTVSRLSYLCGVGLAAALGLVGLIFASPYRMRRLVSFLNPFDDATKAGYQLMQSLIAVGSGGMFGVGLGAGRQKLFYLPAAHTDFIFALVAEELGLAGALFVLLLFLLIGYRGLVIARRSADNPYRSSLAIGLTALIVVPGLLNMAVVTGLLPTKGLVLPLVAYGGTAMVVNLTAMGFLMRLSRNGN